MYKIKNTTPQGMSPQDIKDALARNGVNQAAIARALKKNPVSVGDVVRGRSTSKEIHKAIAEAIHKDVKEIWPALYLHGEPKRGRKKCFWDRKAA